MKFWTVDAFAQEIFHGNPAAVCIIPNQLESSLMQKIAAEFNLSETAFARQMDPNRFELRWFTPKCEVDLCGHATLATSFVLFQTQLVQGHEIIFQTHSGELKVVNETGCIAMDFPSQGKFLNYTGDLGGAFDRQLNVLSAVRALDDLIIEIDSDSDVRELVPNIGKLSKIDCRGIIVTAQDRTGQYDFISRFFAPRVGVNEDPVTGSAHCKLVPYWAEKIGKTAFKAYQASERGGCLDLELVGERVKMRGTAVISTAGELFLAHR